MIRLIVNNRVLNALKVAVPKGNKADDYLAKYVANLEREVNQRLLQTRTLPMIRSDHYYASLTTVQEKGGQIWTLKNTRFHKWLADNNLSLVDQVNKGQANNITGDIAIIKFTSLVEVVDDESIDSLARLTDAELDQYMQSVPVDELAFHQALLVPLQQAYAAGEADLLAVDLDATIAYVKRVARSATLKAKDQTEYRKALRILRISQLNQGVFPQIKRKSSFGRTYYEGVSIQSVQKDLRKAILHGCYEYDVKSSVISWKYAFANELLASVGAGSSAEDEFWAIQYYLDYKKEYFDELQAKVFDSNCGWDDLKQKRKLKEALTALSFGAKLADITWKSASGKDEQSSLARIFPNSYIEERKRFLAAAEVVAFKHQQSKLDAFVVSKFISQYPYLSSMPELQTGTGRRSNSKVLAWLYQHAETLMMDIVRNELQQYGVAIKANIHDAIVVDRKLTLVEKSSIEAMVRQQTGVMLFEFGETLYQ
jgi:hypothetical protein